MTTPLIFIEIPESPDVSLGVRAACVAMRYIIGIFQIMIAREPILKPSQYYEEHLLSRSSQSKKH